MGALGDFRAGISIIDGASVPLRNIRGSMADLQLTTESLRSALSSIERRASSFAMASSEVLQSFRAMRNLAGQPAHPGAHARPEA